MAYNYQMVKLGEHLYVKGRIGWKGLKKSEYLEKSNYRIINGESLEVNGINWSKCGYISEERYEESPEIMLQDGDILISKDGTIGKLGYVSELTQPTSVASGIFVIRNLQKDIIDTDYLYYFFKTPYFKNFIKSRTEGSVIPHLYQKDFVDMDFKIFDLEIQKKIAYILKTIDQKIQVNNQLNANLEELVANIFEKLFDLETVEYCAISELIEVRDGTHASPKPVDEGYPLVTSKHLLKYGVNKTDANKISKEDYDKVNERSRVDKGDILLSMIGTVGLISYVMDDIIDYAIKNVGLFKSSNTRELQYFTLSYLKSTKITNHINMCLAGSTQKYISLTELRKLPFPLFEREDIKEFNLIVEPIFLQIKSLNDENSTLIILRDLLLEKLMSGEIDL